MKSSAVALMLALITVSGLAFADPWIYFRSDRDVETGRYSLFAMNPDGSDPVNLSKKLGISDPFIDWSPDGTKIAFARSLPDDFEVVGWDIIPGAREIFVINADGSELVNLSNHDGDERHPRWSPDGTKIAFESDRDGEWKIFVMNADGSDPIALGVGRFPAWSPDGTKIIFEVPKARAWLFDAFIMDSDGSGRRKLVDLPNLEATYPFSWSPDGTKVMVIGSTHDDAHNKIFVLDADGSDLIDITKDLTPAKGFRFIFLEAWSPDGTKIAFSTLVKDGGADGDLNRDIFAVNVDGANPINLTNHPAWDWGAAWSPDGSKIIFESDRDGGRDIFIMDADGSNALNLTNHPAEDIEPRWMSFDGRNQSTYLTPEDKLIATWGQIKRGNREKR